MKKAKAKVTKKVTIDLRTQKGVYATGFQIKTSKDIGLIDFGFDTPEGNTTIVSRVIVPLELLKALSERIDKENEKKTVGSKK